MTVANHAWSLVPAVALIGLATACGDGSGGKANDPETCSECLDGGSGNDASQEFVPTSPVDATTAQDAASPRRDGSLESIGNNSDGGANTEGGANTDGGANLGTVTLEFNTNKLTVARGQYAWLTITPLPATYKGAVSFSVVDLPPSVSADFLAVDDMSPIASNPLGGYAIIDNIVSGTADGNAISTRIYVAPDAPLGVHTVNGQAIAYKQTTVVGAAPLELEVVDGQDTTTPRWIYLTSGMGGRVCGQRSDSRTYCWGTFQIGDGSLRTRYVPTAVSGNHQFTQIAMGANHTCALTPAADLYCWGANGGGMLAQAEAPTDVRRPSTRPIRAARGFAFSAIASGDFHTCGLTADGRAHCWGIQFLLGDGSPAQNEHKTTPSKVLGDHQFASIACGPSTTCALDAAGKAWCWGANLYGQVGYGGPFTELPNEPLPVAGGLTFTKLALSSSFTCGLVEGGKTYCWGQGSFVDGSSVNKYSPVAVASSMSFVDMAAGDKHMCLLNAEGTVYCWGDNYYGQLGTGDSGSQAQRSAPTAIAGALRFKRIAGGSTQTCGITLAGQAYCWGRGNSGRLGDGTAMDRSVPTAVRTF